MKSRQPLDATNCVVVQHYNHRIVVRFRPDQRKVARCILISRCHRLGLLIPLDHPAFDEIDRKTWEPVA